MDGNLSKEGMTADLEAMKKDSISNLIYLEVNVDSVANDHDINPYLGLLKNNGTYINMGMPAKPWEVTSFSLAAGNKVIEGFGAGGLPETQEMLNFFAKHNIVSDIELINIKDIHTALEKMEKGDVRYRFVIDMATL